MSITHTDGRELSEKMAAVASDMEQSARVLLSARMRNRPHSIPVSDGHARMSADGILEEALSLTQAASSLVACAEKRQRELASMGRAFVPLNPYKNDSEWVEGLISAAHAVAATVSHLVTITDGVAMGTEEIGKLIVATNAVNAASVRLMTASRVKDSGNSDAHLHLEEATRKVSECAEALLKSAQSLNSSAYQESISEGPSASPSLTAEKVMEMEHQLRILKLEEELERERVALLDHRKKTYKHDA